MLVNACDNIVQSVYWSTENHNTLLKVYSSMENAGMEYCLSIHQIHWKEMYKYWMTDMSIPVTQRWSGDYITWSKVYIKSSDICRNRILSFHWLDTSERNTNTEWLDMSILEAQWWSGDYITWSKVYIKLSDICRNRILSFHPPDTSERNIQILNDLI